MTPTRQSIDVNGTQRGFLLAEPEGPPTAVILSLHGTRSSAPAQVRLSRLGTLGVAAGAVVAFPEAIQPIGRGYEWNPDIDMAYLRRLVDRLGERYPSAGEGVSITGMSGGARMSCLFAYRHADLVRMVGAVAGLRAPGEAALARPVPVLAFHGTSDRINPYAGSGTARWDESVPEAASLWATANGVTSPPTTIEVSPHVTLTRYGAEGARDETALWTVKGAGHTWPGSPLGPLLRLFLGKTTTEIDATRTILASPQRSTAS